MPASDHLPLSGLTVGRAGTGRHLTIAEWLLTGLGAAAGPSSPDLVLGSDRTPVSRAPAGCRWHGVPSATVDYALGAAVATAALAGWRSGRPIGVSEIDVAVQVFLPEVMALSYSSPTAMRPARPRRAPGPGWLHADLGTTGDPDRFASLLETLPADSDASTVAAAAQEWRLPVCDYRLRSFPQPRLPISVVPEGRCPVGRRSRTGGRPLAGVVVTDLTAMWAGPLATWLLHGLGATVRKVEPDVRLDGFRSLDGRGIHPHGLHCAPGDSAMWNALNEGKIRAPLDLRSAQQRVRFLELAGRSDVVIDAYSPRVMPNFGLSELPPGPAWVSMPAFPPGPHRCWVAYGTGVHALLGLGDRGNGTFTEPLVSYPDPLAGFVAALAAVAAIVGRDRGRPVARMEVPLAAAAQPLAAWSAPAEEPDPELTPGPALLAGGSFERRLVAGWELPHPCPPFLDRAWA